MAHVNEVEISFSPEFRDFEVSVLTIDTSMLLSEDEYNKNPPVYNEDTGVVLGRCLLKTILLSEATCVGMKYAVDHHIPLSYSKACMRIAEEIHPGTRYVLNAEKLVCDCNQRFFESERRRFLGEVEDFYEGDDEDES